MFHIGQNKRILFILFHIQAKSFCFLHSSNTCIWSTSQLIRYYRACGVYQDFLDKGVANTEATSTEPRIPSDY